MAAWWCDLGRCSRTIAVMKLRRTSALRASKEELVEAVESYMHTKLFKNMLPPDEQFEPFHVSWALVA